MNKIYLVLSHAVTYILSIISLAVILYILGVLAGIGVAGVASPVYLMFRYLGVV